MHRLSSRVPFPTTARRSPSIAALRSFVAPLVVVLLAACAATDQYGREKVRTSGFLTDYSRLEEGGEGEPRLFYVAEDARLGRFRKAHVTVALYLDEASRDNVSEQAQADLANTLKAKIEDVLEDDYELVGEDELDADTLVIRAALTQAYGSFVPLNVLSTVVPEGFILSKASQWTTGWRPFVGKAAIEAEFLAGPGGEPLVQLVDGRIGNKTIDSGLLETYGDTSAAFDVWAEQLEEFLASERALEAERAAGA